MLFGNRGPRSLDNKQRRSAAYRPHSEELEPKMLLASLELGYGTPFNLAGQTTVAPNGPQTIGGQLPFIADSTGVNPQTQGNQTTDPGLGVLETGGLQSAGAGYNVAAVGDMNLDGSNDYLIGAPGVTSSGSSITAASNVPSQVFLVFGNRSASLPNVQNWLSSTPEQRVGLLGAPGPGLGNTVQTNPFTDRGAPYNYNFDGVSFVTTADPTSGLGAFVASAGTNAIVIGAPNYTGGGRLYYITATSNFNQGSLRSAPIDLDNPQNYPGLTIVTFEDTANPTSGLGTSFADVPDIFGDGTDTLAIGEPGASLNGKTGNGGVFLFPITSIPMAIGVNNVVQVQAQSPFTIVGANSGDGAGASLADAGDVNGLTGPGTTPISDLLIGAPNFNNGAGAAYLVYGGSTLTNAVG
ncbi:MAG: integrin alpha, partial [Isosphaeraceae bacterium]